MLELLANAAMSAKADEEMCIRDRNEAHSMVTKSLSTTTAKRFSIPQFNVNLTKRKGLFSLFTLDYGRNGKIQVKSRPGTAYG